MPPVLIRPTEGEAGKRAAFAAADLALVSSGTVVIEMAAAATPMVSAHRDTWLTGAIRRRLMRVESDNLVNLVSGEWVVPEFAQERCTAARIAPALEALLDDPAAGAAQRAAFRPVLEALGRDGEAPALRAAKSVLRVLG
jgi:lipid-A-disaccharide synthase